jgi:hypothetical protein
MDMSVILEGFERYRPQDDIVHTKSPRAIRIGRSARVYHIRLQAEILPVEDG